MRLRSSLLIQSRNAFLSSQGSLAWRRRGLTSKHEMTSTSTPFTNEWNDVVRTAVFIDVINVENSLLFDSPCAAKMLLRSADFPKTRRLRPRRAGAFWASKGCRCWSCRISSFSAESVLFRVRFAFLERTVSNCWPANSSSAADASTL